MTTSTLLRCIALSAAVALGACADAPVEPETSNVVTRSSFEQLQAKVLSTSCATAGCHVTGSAMATESGLVLESAVAYANLVGVEPKNPNAKRNGLLRVAPGSPDSSFLFIKLHDPSHHAGYGAQMPLGMDPLSNGKIEFIRQWIAAGAPRTGSVADSTLLDDDTQVDDTFTPLAPPAPGSGFQVSTGLFEIAPNFERELLIYRRIGNADTLYVNRIETKMRPGSHHLVLYYFQPVPATPALVMPAFDEIRDIRRPDGSEDREVLSAMNYHWFLSGAMTPHETYTFPEGVALKLPADFAIDVNSHYVNATSKPRIGEAYANFYTIPRSQVRDTARPLFLNFDEFTLPPGQRTTVRKRFNMPRKRSIFLLNSHMHKRGERFVIRIGGGPRDGEVVYESTDWAHPPVKTFNDDPIVLEAGQGLVSEVTYYNETNRPITFGLTSEDEMDIIYAYYY